MRQTANNLKTRLLQRFIAAISPVGNLVLRRVSQLPTGWKEIGRYSTVLVVSINDAKITAEAILFICLINPIAYL
jgi:hypothetical protein